MFDTRTALVLGAGASVPFGYPLGPKLIDNIAEGLKKALKRSPPETWPTASFDFIGNSYDIFVDYVNMFWEQPMRDRLQKVAAYLSTASHASIDDVARTNPSMRRIIKILVALEIARASYEREEFRKNKLKPSRVLFRRSDENWYARLISKLTEDCHEPEDIYSNALSVITFNYDMSLEHYLHDKLPASELFRKVEVDRVCRPLHIHGQLVFDIQTVANLNVEFAKSLVSCDDQFRMIGDERDPTLEPGMAGRYLLDKAERIFVLGFDFHTANVDLLNLGDPKIVSKLIVLNWDGSARLSRKLVALGVPTQNVWSGTPAAPYSIAKAIDDGVFDANPAWP